MKKELSKLLMLFSTITFSQVKVTNENNSKINQNAILQLESLNKDKGFLLPRLSLESTILASPLTNHENGMVVYNTSTTTGDYGTSPGIYLNNGTKWIKLKVQSNHENGDIKYSFKTSDHDGWYLLDGRNVSTLPSNVIDAASLLGFTTNLPNSTDAFIMNKTSDEFFNQIVGDNNITLLPENLPPDIDFSGTTASAGAHTHGYTDNNITQNPNRLGRLPISPDVSEQRTTSSSGNHSHTFSANLGDSTPINYIPESINANIFIYLKN